MGTPNWDATVAESIARRRISPCPCCDNAERLAISLDLIDQMRQSMHYLNGRVSDDGWERENRRLDDMRHDDGHMRG